MTDWFFAEQQSLYRQEQFRKEAARRDAFALLPRTSIRARVAGALIATAMRLAPSASACRLEIITAQLNGERPLTGIAGS